MKQKSSAARKNLIIHSEGFQGVNIFAYIGLKRDNFSTSCNTVEDTENISAERELSLRQKKW